MNRTARSPSLPHRHRGFTLQEMLITLAITGSLAGGGVSLWNLVQENAQTAAANELVAHLALARSEAIKRGVDVRFCPSRDGSECLEPAADFTYWHHGWMAYADKNGNRQPEPNEIVRVHPGAARDLVIRTSRHRASVTYHPIGTSGGSTITFALCDSRGPERARYVTLQNGGRARVSRTTTSSAACR